MLKVGQLWFLPALFVAAIMNYPLLAWSRRRRSQEPLGSQDAMLALAQAVALNLYLLLAYMFMTSENFSYVLPASIVV